MNTVSIAGRVTEEPTKAKSSNGTQYAKFKMAVDKANKDNGTNAYDLFEVTVFRDLADLKLENGQFVGVTGRLSANNYEREGKSFYNCQIIGSTVNLFGC